VGLLQEVRRDTSIKYVKLFCDSQAAILAMQNQTGHKSVNEAVKTLNRVREKCRYLTIVWTKAHIVTEGNERADKLAKEEAESGTQIEVGLPMYEKKKEVDEYVVKQWNKEWEEYTEGRQSKLFIQEYNPARSKEVMRMGRYNIGRVIIMVTGHNALGYHQHIIDRRINPLCRFCKEENETFWHFSTECPVFREARNDCFLDKDPTTGKWVPSELIEFGENNKIYEAFEGMEWGEEDPYNNHDTTDNSQREPD
jgi:hypothetical protein